MGGPLRAVARHKRCIRINSSGQNSTNLRIVKRPEGEILGPSCETKGEPIRRRERTRVPTALAASPWLCSRQGTVDFDLKTQGAHTRPWAVL